MTTSKYTVPKLMRTDKMLISWNDIVAFTSNLCPNTAAYSTDRRNRPMAAVKVLKLRYKR